MFVVRTIKFVHRFTVYSDCNSILIVYCVSFLHELINIDNYDIDT